MVAASPVREKFYGSGPAAALGLFHCQCDCHTFSLLLEGGVDVSGNDLAIGFSVRDWQPCEPPAQSPMQGRFCTLELLDPVRDSADLWEAFSADTVAANWTYLPYGPFDDKANFQAWVRQVAAGEDPLFFSIFDNDSGAAVGIASFLRIEAQVGVIEVGHIYFADCLQRTPLATEAMFLMMERVFDEGGYRRYEWKCDALNARSRRAAERLGFEFEGVFRQASLYKNRNRDTAWFAVIDSDWPPLKAAFTQWLAPENFDEAGQQRQRLQDFR